MLLSSGPPRFMGTPESSSGALSLRVTLVYSPTPRQIREWQVALKPGATLRQALEACGFFLEFPELDERRMLAGIWGRRVRLDHPLADQDRLEIYRALRVDPQTARRERFNRQGAKTAGLFSQKRPGAKAGY